MHPHRPRLLVVDDDRAFLAQIGTIATEEGFDVATTPRLEDAAIHLRTHHPALVLVDVARFGSIGDVLTGHLKMAACPIALISSRVSAAAALDAVNHGAIDYLGKPLDGPRARALLAATRLQTESRRVALAMERDVANQLAFEGMVGRGSAMQDVFDRIRRLAPHARIALVSGEPGTGKTLAARALHQRGPRRRGPLVIVNCADAVETLLDNELFGSAAGAAEGVPGAFETAVGGAILLKEVTELPPTLQVKLLGALSASTIGFIATTSRDMERLVTEGRFLPDLHQCLTVAELRLPPLRERREDLPYLTASMIGALAQRFERPVAGLTPAAERYLANAQWCGNVRELRQVLERACALAEGEFLTEQDLIAAAPLQPVIRTECLDGSGWTGPFRHHAVEQAGAVPLLDVQRAHIMRTLQRVNGNKAVAARQLGLSRRAFYRQLERHGLHTRIAAARLAASASSVQERHS